MRWNEKTCKFCESWEKVKDDDRLNYGTKTKPEFVHTGVCKSPKVQSGTGKPAEGTLVIGGLKTTANFGCRLFSPGR